jgi:hypothetical protein
MTEAKCICCQKVVEQNIEEDEEFSLDGGLWFSSRGGWPSSVFDPCVETGFDQNRWDELKVFICDECLRAKKKEIPYVRLTRKVEIEHNVDSWDHHDTEMKEFMNEAYPNQEVSKQ